MAIAWDRKTQTCFYRWPFYWRRVFCWKVTILNSLFSEGEENRNWVEKRIVSWVLKDVQCWLKFLGNCEKKVEIKRVEKITNTQNWSNLIKKLPFFSISQREYYSFQRLKASISVVHFFENRKNKTLDMKKQRTRRIIGCVSKRSKPNTITTK